MGRTTKTSTARVSTALRLEQLDATGGSRRLRGRLRYDREDPYAASLAISDGGRAVEWVFARELLAEGLLAPSGDGDVHVWPCLDDCGSAILLLELRSAQGVALLQADPRQVMHFLALSRDVVAPGGESELVDVDSFLVAVLGEPPTEASAA